MKIHGVTVDNTANVGLSGCNQGSECNNDYENDNVHMYGNQNSSDMIRGGNRTDSTAVEDKKRTQVRLLIFVSIISIIYV